MNIVYNDSPFIAIIGDIKNSRKSEGRNLIQYQLRMVLDKINRKYKKDITSKFLITLGDEFQGLLSDGKNIIKIIEEIRIQLYPVELRFGIGIGEITTDINTEMALGADGPGYYNAREAIEKIKKNEKKNKAVTSDMRLETNQDKEHQVTLINTIFELIKAIEQNWTARQREIIWNMRQYQDGQINVAARMGIAQSSVNKALLKGRYYVYDNSIEIVEGILGEIKI